MKKRPMCLVCLGLALGIWLMRLAGLPVFGEPEKRRLETLVQSEETVQVRGQVQDYEIKDNSKSYLITSCVLKNQENEIPVKKLYLITQQEEIFPTGSVINTEGVLEETEHPVNPGQFDAASWYAAKGIFYTMWAEEIRTVQPAEPGIRDWLKQWQNRMAQRLAVMLPESQAGILSAMLLGDKSLLEPETKAVYQMGGVLHVLSISGLHLSMLGMGLYRLLQKIGCHKAVSSVLAVAMMALYTIFTGNGVATRRAFLMFTIMVIGGLIGRTYDSLSALALAAVITLIGQPENLPYSGFILSYAAVLGTALVWPLWKKGRRTGEAVERTGVFRAAAGDTGISRKSSGKEKGFHTDEKTDGEKEGRIRQKKEAVLQFWTGLKENALACTVITLTTLPLTAYFFYEIPLLSILPNLLILPTMVWVMGFGILGCCAGMFSIALGKLLLLPASLLLHLYEAVMKGMQRIPGAVWICGQPSFVQVVVYYLLLTALLLGISWVSREENVEKPLAVLWFSWKGRIFQGGFLAIAVACLLFRWNHPLSITALDVGQGDSLVVCEGNRTTWLIDGGSTDEKNVGNYRILPYLKSQGIGTLDGVFVTHSDDDHVNGIQELLELSAGHMTALRIRQLFLPVWMKKSETGKGLERLADEAGAAVRYIQKGDTVSAGGLTMRVLHPDGEDYQEEPNAGSIVLALNYGDFDALLTGDVEADGEEKLLEELQTYSRNDSRENCQDQDGSNDQITSGNPGQSVNGETGTDWEYLKVAHHGSKNSTPEEFLAAVSPEVSIISCSASSRYGHPHRELLERLWTVGTDVYTTPDNGAITCITDGKQYRIRGYRDTILCE